jgi:hypothetical protein
MINNPFIYYTYFSKDIIKKIENKDKDSNKSNKEKDKLNLKKVNIGVLLYRILYLEEILYTTNKFKV